MLCEILILFNGLSVLFVVAVAFLFRREVKMAFGIATRMAESQMRLSNPAGMSTPSDQSGQSSTQKQPTESSRKPIKFNKFVAKKTT